MLKNKKKCAAFKDTQHIKISDKNTLLTLNVIYLFHIFENSFDTGNLLYDLFQTTVLGYLTFIRRHFYIFLYHRQ